jgi:uncharacterized membrane protein YeiB
MAPPRRISGFDIARALAVFGMVLVNFKVVMGTEGRGPAWLAQLAGLFDGRAAATFVVLAGVGLSLLVGRAPRPGTRAKLLKRALFLFVVGLAYTPIWPADILHFYGVYIAVAALVIGWSSRALLGLALGLVAMFPVLLFVLDYERGWDWETLSYAGFWTAPGMLRHLFFNGFHPVVPWLAFLLVGVVLGRLELGRAALRRQLLLGAALVAAAAELASRGLLRVLDGVGGAEGDELWSALLGTAPMPPSPLYIVAAGATAVAVILVCVELGETGARGLQPLVVTGQLALTLYVAHVVLGMGLLESAGRLEHQSLAFALASAVLFYAASVGFAVLWRRRFDRGPLEWVMRKLTG